MQSSRDHPEKVPVHQDDFKARLAWVTAKRFHELVPGKNFRDKPVDYQNIGLGIHAPRIGENSL
jgi:hypothetical protein